MSAVWRGRGGAFPRKARASWCAHLRRQAWPGQHPQWERVAGTGKAPELRLTCHEDSYLE